MFDCPTVLPVELIYIKATPIDNQYIKVSWSTASELNSKTFEVLRSIDGIHFEKIGELPAAGNSNSQKIMNLMIILLLRNCILLSG